MKKFIVAIALMSLAACSANTNIKSGLYANLPDQKPKITLGSIEAISKLKPQISPPIKIAVTQPIRDSWHGGNDEWTSEEINEIESWLPALKASGLVSDLVVIPRSLQGNCETGNTCYRTAAAQLQADAVLTIGRSMASDQYLNPLSFLDITLVGLWLVPGHNVDAYAIYEAVLMDTKNGYIYGIARGEGEASKIRPKMYIETDTGQNEASLLALKSLAKQLNEKAKDFIKFK